MKKELNKKEEGEKKEGVGGTVCVSVYCVSGEEYGEGKERG